MAILRKNINKVKQKALEKYFYKNYIYSHFGKALQLFKF